MHKISNHQIPSYTNRREFLRQGLYAGLAASLTGSLWLNGCRQKPSGEKPNIILMTLDTTRADRLSCYGYYRRTSPNLDKLAGESVLYTRAIAPSSWTLPSHVSLFTGKFTSSHGAKYDPKGPLKLTHGIPGPKSWDLYRARGMAEDELTLAALLKQAGYATAAVAGGPWLKKPFGLNKGFDFYDDDNINTVNGKLAHQVTFSALNWIEKQRNEKFFLFLNYFDPHGPYAPPGEFRWAFLPKNTEFKLRKPTVSEINALYDGEILFMDHYIGLLLDKLKSLNLYDNTWIIVTADHGELLGEHDDFGHGKSLWQEEIHVPLFLKYPAGEAAPKQSEIRIQLIDIPAMILKRLGIDLPEGIQGNVPPSIEHPIISETYPLSFMTKAGNWQVIFEQDYKFFWNSKGHHMLFDLNGDPGETNNLAEQDQRRAKTLMVKLEEYLVNLPPPGPVTPARQLDQQTRDALRGLGYVE